MKEMGFLTVLLVALFAVPSRAATVKYLTLPELSELSERIVIARVEGQRVEHQVKPLQIVTETTFRIENTLKGEKSSLFIFCLLYTSPSPRDATLSRMPSSA